MSESLFLFFSSSSLSNRFFLCPDLLLFRHDRAKAVDILVKDLKVFSAFNEDLFKEITQLLTLDNFRYSLTEENLHEFLFTPMV